MTITDLAVIIIALILVASGAGCLYFYLVARTWKARHDALLAKPFNFWREREIQRQMIGQALQRTQEIVAGEQATIGQPPAPLSEDEPETQGPGESPAPIESPSPRPRRGNRKR